MSLKVYADLMSQPSRAVVLFVRANRIPHEFKKVLIHKADQKQPEYMKINPFGRVPAIDDNGFKLTESVAILRYLARKYQVPDHWYPKDSLEQSRVDEFLEWHHLGLRMHLSSYFLAAFVKPMLTGKPANEKSVEFWKGKMNLALDDMENIWLKKNPYVTGFNISIADLIGVCEIEQPKMMSFDPTENRPKLAAWMRRVREDLEPHYSDVMKPVNQIIESRSKL